uniref:SFRICE_023302 n=1 Tax=Spodoptera frugiperda TaxID=7108 RepID=A0A2H1WTE3_SPOFR
MNITFSSTEGLFIMSSVCRHGDVDRSAAQTPFSKLFKDPHIGHACESTVILKYIIIIIIISLFSSTAGYRPLQWYATELDLQLYAFNHYQPTTTALLLPQPCGYRHSSLHLAGGRPTLRLPRRGLHSRTRLPQSDRNIDPKDETTIARNCFQGYAPLTAVNLWMGEQEYC